MTKEEKGRMLAIIERYKCDAKLLEEINDDGSSIFEDHALDLQEFIKESEAIVINNQSMV
jgi:hypothetical protein